LRVADVWIGQSKLDFDRPIPGQGFVGSDGVVFDPVVLGVSHQIQVAGDLFKEQLLVFQRAESSLA
jgi:hypothetical protein